MTNSKKGCVNAMTFGVQNNKIASMGAGLFAQAQNRNTMGHKAQTNAADHNQYSGGYAITLSGNETAARPASKPTKNHERATKTANAAGKSTQNTAVNRDASSQHPYALAAPPEQQRKPQNTRYKSNQNGAVQESRQHGDGRAAEAVYK